MKYIIMDLDDTLLTTDKRITEYSKNVLKKYQNQGIKVCFNTARNFKSAFPYIEDLKPDYSILNGGSQIYDKDYHLIYSETISLSVTSKIIDKIIHDIDVINYSIQTETELYSMDLKYVSHNPIANYFDFKHNKFNYPAAKILISAKDNDKWIKIAKEYNLEMESYFDGTWFRLSPSNKYKGNQTLFSLLNDNDHEEYVFGDDNGDVLMIDNAYHGVFLKNSNKRLLEKAKHITLFDNDNDGVVKYLEKILEDNNE